MIKDLFPDFGCQKGFPVSGCPDQVNPYLYIFHNFFYCFGLKPVNSAPCLYPRPEGQGNACASGMEYYVELIIPAHQNKIEPDVNVPAGQDLGRI